MLTNKRITGKPQVKKEQVQTNPRKMVIPRPDVLHAYLEHSQINQYLNYLGNRYPNFVTVHTIGSSYERRELKAIEINWLSPQNVTTNDFDIVNRARSAPAPVGYSPPARMPGMGDKIINLETLTNGRNIVFIEGGTHAREWITITTALNCIYQLTERHLRNIELLRKLQFYIVPVVNPDGYEYTRTKNKRWRKNRRPHKHTKYVGTDCNRNYDFHWETGPTKLNRNTYKGEKPFSEPETRALRNVLKKLESNLLFFLSLHSYGQSIMYPWGYSRDLPTLANELQTLAVTGRNAIKSYNGRHYRTGSIANLTKRTISGSIVDYVYGVLKIPLALVMELPSQDLGFQPPTEMISPIGHESWFGIREMCKRAFDMRTVLPKEPIYTEFVEIKMETPTNTETSTASTSTMSTAPAPKKNKRRRGSASLKTLKMAHDAIVQLQKSARSADAAKIAKMNKSQATTKHGIAGLAERAQNPLPILPHATPEVAAAFI